MSQTQTKDIKAGHYVVAGIGFIPLIGVPFALFCVIFGLFKWKKGGETITIIGLLGIALTGMLNGNLYYQGFVVRGGTFDKLRTEFANNSITDLVKEIEYYKNINGEYPKELSTLKEKSSNKMLTIYDPTFVGERLQTFYYKLSDDNKKYYLLGQGPDQIPFTQDDIVPQIASNEMSKTGLIVKKQK